MVAIRAATRSGRGCLPHPAPPEPRSGSGAGLGRRAGSSESGGVSPTRTFSSTVMPAQELEVLECPADTDPDDIVRRPLQHGAAFELDRAFGGIAEPRDAIEHCRLAGAVRPDQGMDRALRDVHREIVQCAEAAETDRKIPDGKDRAHDAGLPSFRSGWRRLRGACKKCLSHAPKAARHEHGGEHQDQSVGELLPHQEAARRGAQNLGEQPDQHHADEDAGNRAGAADHHHGQHQDELGEPYRVGIDEGLEQAYKSRRPIQRKRRTARRPPFWYASRRCRRPTRRARCHGSRRDRDRAGSASGRA